MVKVIDERNAMGKVKETLQWIDKLQIPRFGVIPPFDDCASLPKLLFADTVENMTLNKYVMNGEEIEGVRLLGFRGTEWLGSTCLRAGLIMLARRYASHDIGFFTPDWFPFSDVSTRQKAAAMHGAFHATVQRQIGVVNVGGFHWVAFYLDVTSDHTRICTGLAQSR
ncbi:hypothetical protein PR001_g28121 [Phytophthora rubi]|uniref:Ubiquitin-like protease family profile domain-containing protein n=1 Tax=Phytophthora rubi TaxID=129364 RepID=A0A6A3HD03_9STRA|nr:hypothetical protein PR001_g28121 [Phytophthora rubi]